jgi:hypothetical protein
MRFLAAAALAAALAACGGDDGAQLAAGNSRLTAAQVDAALGPADQSAIEDALPEDAGLNGIGNLGNESTAAGNSAAAEDGDE